MNTEEIFPIDISYQSNGGPVFNTQIERRGAGSELRNQVWQFPLHRYDATIRPREENQIDSVKNFFMAMRGRFKSFRWRDWNDWLNDMSDRIPERTFANVSVNNVFTYQLLKRYYSGSNSLLRVITKPRVQGTIAEPSKYPFRLWVDNVERVFVGAAPAANEFTVDHTTGIITLGFNPGNDAPIEAIYEFDVKCRFDTDAFEPSKIASFVQEVTSIPITEVR